MRTRIYRLKNSVTQDVTLVRATSQASALMAMEMAMAEIAEVEG